MTAPSAVQIVDRAIRLRMESKQEAPTYDLLVGEGLSDEQVARAWLSLGEYSTAVAAAVKALGDEWVRRYQARGEKPIEVDGHLVLTKTGRPVETCIDSPGFLAWLEANPQMVHMILNPNEVKKGSLPPAVRSTFFERRDVVKPEDQPKPSAIPLEILEQNRAKKELANG